MRRLWDMPIDDLAARARAGDWDALTILLCRANEDEKAAAEWVERLNRENEEEMRRDLTRESGES